jgi:hypothetical protein
MMTGNRGKMRGAGEHYTWFCQRAQDLGVPYLAHGATCGVCVPAVHEEPFIHALAACFVFVCQLLLAGNDGIVQCYRVREVASTVQLQGHCVLGQVALGYMHKGERRCVSSSM